MLRMIPEYKDAEVVRTRDEKVLETLPIIVDVGGQYNPSKGRFDHHQREFTDTLSPVHKTKLSSSGIVYKHFGRQILSSLTNLKDAELELLYNKVYESFMEALDGIDNGISQYPPELTPNYTINTDLSSRISRLNPTWNEHGINSNDRFKDAMELAGREFVESAISIAKVWMPARSIVQKAMEKRFQYHSTGEIVVLEDYTVWKRHLLELESELKVPTPIKYILFSDQSNKWRIQAIPINSGSFVCRKPLPETWRGLRDEKLSKLANIDKCIFVHASGFIGGNDTFEGVLEMAKKSLLMDSSCTIETDDETAIAKRRKVTAE